MIVYRCEKTFPNQFDEVYTKGLVPLPCSGLQVSLAIFTFDASHSDFEESKNQMQEESREVQGVSARFLKFVIKEGWENFSCVHLVDFAYRHSHPAMRAGSRLLMSWSASTQVESIGTTEGGHGGAQDDSSDDE